MNNLPCAPLSLRREQRKLIQQERQGKQRQ
jgi:hypothetical protein